MKINLKCKNPHFRGNFGDSGPVPFCTIVVVAAAFVNGNFVEDKFLLASPHVFFSPTNKAQPN